jgi:VanZ family protein
VALLLKVFPFPCFDCSRIGMDHVSISNSMKRSHSIAVRWILFLTYAVMILFASAQSSLPGQGLIPDKLVHATEYFIFAILTARVLQAPGVRHLPRNLLVAWIFCVILAALDEFLQSNIPGRDASLGDWAADISGNTIAILLLLKRSYEE